MVSFDEKRKSSLKKVAGHSFLPDVNGRVMPIAHYYGQITVSALESLREKFGNCFQFDGDYRCLFSFSEACSRELVEKGCFVKQVGKSASVYMSAL